MWPNFLHSDPSPLSAQLPALQGWLKTARGQQFFQRQQELLQSELPYIFGYHGAQLGVADSLDLLDVWPLGYKFALQLAGQTLQDSRSVISEAIAWPVQPRSLDLVLLHHALEFSAEPHRLLREAGKSVIPGGKVVIIGFNPWSFWGGYSQCAWGAERCLRGGHFLSVRRLHDWLKLLNFSLDKVVYGAPLQPFYRTGRRDGWVEQQSRRAGLPFGSFYIIQATKERMQMSGTTPRRTRRMSTIVGGTLTGASRGRGAFRRCSKKLLEKPSVIDGRD